MTTLLAPTGITTHAACVTSGQPWALNPATRDTRSGSFPDR